MNILKYKGETYQILHTINDNETYCSAVIAKEGFASDLVGHLSHRHNLANYYTLVREQIGEYRAPYDTHKILYKGVKIGYWDFPIPPKYSRFTKTHDADIGNIEDIAAEYRMLDHIRNLKIHKKNSDLFTKYAREIDKAYKSHDWDALDMLFGFYDYEPSNKAMKLELEHSDIEIDLLSYPKILSSSRSAEFENPPERCVAPNLERETEPVKEDILLRFSPRRVQLNRKEVAILVECLRMLGSGKLPDSEMLRRMGVDTCRIKLPIETVRQALRYVSKIRQVYPDKEILLDKSVVQEALASVYKPKSEPLRIPRRAVNAMLAAVYSMAAVDYKAEEFAEITRDMCAIHPPAVIVDNSNTTHNQK